MKEEIGYTVTVKANPKFDTLIINDKDWGRMDIGLVLEISKRVNVQPTSAIDEGKAYLLSKKDLEIDWLKHPFEPLV